MRKFLHIIVFAFILGFLLYLVPPVNQFLRTQVLDSTFTYTFTAPDPVFVEPPAGFPTDERYVKIYTGQIVVYSSLNSVPAHEPNCAYQHLHLPSSFGFDIDGDIVEDPDPSGCGLGRDPGVVLASSQPPVEVYCGDGTVNQASEQCDDGNSVNDDACSNECEIKEIIEPNPVIDDPVLIGNQVFIGEVYCGDGIINQPGEQCEPPNTPTCDANCKIILPPPPPGEEDGLTCPVEENKQFDYGAFASIDPRWNLPWGTIEAPHFASHTQFFSVKIGPSVDAPEYVAEDASAADQDALVIDLSTKGKIVLSEIYNLREDYGTIIVGRWEKKAGFYEFKVLNAVRITQATPAMYQSYGFEIFFDADPLTGLAPEMKEGWLTVMYFDAEGDVDPNVPGSHQFAIDGKPNYGFTLAEIKGIGGLPQWNGTNPDLDRIIYRRVLDPFDPSRVAGEVEDYLYCDKGPNGFRYYRPNDPQYLIDCGVPEVPVPEIILNTPGTDPLPPINVICNFNNVQNFICNPNGGSTTTTGTGTGTGTVTPTNNQPITTILEQLLTTYQGNTTNTAETRLELIHDYLYTLLPQL
ncbi:MAG: hypothetical protein AB7J40_01645 [Candidatus Altimarinota bacterium]